MPSAFTPELWQGLVASSPTRLRVTSDSMTPTLNRGETIELGPVPSLLMPGDILVYQRDEGLVVHRYLGQGRFQGDNAERADPRVARQHIVGIARAVLRDDRLHPIPRRFSPRACIRLIRLQVNCVIAALRPT